MSANVTTAGPWAIVLGLAAAGCGHASADECRAMRERYVDLATRESAGGRPLSPAQADAVR